MFKLVAGFTLVALSAIANAQVVEVAVPGVAPATEQGSPAVPGVAPASSSSERRLTPQQIDAILADNARHAKTVLVGPMPAGGTATASSDACPTTPHGEMGVEMGTDGYGAAYGSAVVPLGCNAAVAIAVGTSGGDRVYSRRRR